VDPDTLLPVDTVERATLAAVAAWFGATRLIDNTVLGAAPYGKERGSANFS
jgi:pantothenate synthetase